MPPPSLPLLLAAAAAAAAAPAGRAGAGAAGVSLLVVVAMLLVFILIMLAVEAFFVLIAAKLLIPRPTTFGEAFRTAWHTAAGRVAALVLCAIVGGLFRAPGIALVVFTILFLLMPVLAAANVFRISFLRAAAVQIAAVLISLLTFYLLHRFGVTP